MPIDAADNTIYILNASAVPQQSCRTPQHHLNLPTLTMSHVYMRQGDIYDPALAVLGFEIPDSSMAISDESYTRVAASPLLGFAMDGRRIYGPFDATGSLARGLDPCNGRWEINGRPNGTAVEVGQSIRAEYTYRATPDFPYLIGCLGPAGASTAAAAAAAVAAAGEEESEDTAGSNRYIFEEDAYPRCPAGSYLSIETGVCRSCEPGSYGKDGGLVGARCPGVSIDRIREGGVGEGHIVPFGGLTGLSFGFLFDFSFGFSTRWKREFWTRRRAAC